VKLTDQASKLIEGGGSFIYWYRLRVPTQHVGIHVDTCVKHVYMDLYVLHDLKHVTLDPKP
jgi:hypothetical protein